MNRILTFITFCYIVANSMLKAQDVAFNRNLRPGSVTQQSFHNPKHPLNNALTPIYDSIYNWTFDTTSGAWDFSSREIKIVYNANNTITSELVQDWNGTVWVNFTTDTFKYNADNLDTSDLEKSWTGSAWENEYHYTYSYDAGNNDTVEVEQIWSGSAWRNYLKYVYTWDAHGNETSETGEQWNGSSWTVGYLYAYTYNLNNLKIEEVDSTAASVNRFLFTYNNNNLLITDTSQAWNGSAWLEEFLNTYSYNAGHSDTSNLMQMWNGSSWTNYERYAYQYDVNNNNTGQLFQIWSNNAWVRFQQYAYTYDANNIMLSDEYRQYFNGGNSVILGDSTYWYFNKTTNGINEIANKGTISIYPNPGKGVFTIEVNSEEQIEKNDDLKIYTIFGQEIYSATTRYSLSTIHLDVPNGMYFIRLITGEDAFTGKLVIQR